MRSLREGGAASREAKTKAAGRSCQIWGPGTQQGDSPSFCATPLYTGRRYALPVANYDLKVSKKSNDVSLPTPGQISRQDATMLNNLNDF